MSARHAIDLFLENDRPFLLVIESEVSDSLAHHNDVAGLMTGMSELDEAVAEVLMADRAVLPVRFGTVLSNEAAVQDVLAAHYADFVASLDRVRGRVELGLRVLWNSEFRNPKSEIRNLNSGRAYLMARLEEERRPGPGASGRRRWPRNFTPPWHG